MRQKTDSFSASLTPVEIFGLTAEQKREMLTHSLIGGQQSALMYGDADALSAPKQAKEDIKRRTI